MQATRDDDDDLQASLLSALKAWMASAGDCSMDLSAGLAISKTTLARLADDGERAVETWQARLSCVRSRAQRP